MDESYIHVPDAFKYFDTYGLPLEMIMDECEKRDVPGRYCVRAALDLFVRDAVSAGWTFNHAIAVCRDALVSKYGSEVGGKVADRLALGMKLHYNRYWPQPEGK